MTQNSPPDTNCQAGLMRLAEPIVSGCICFNVEKTKKTAMCCLLDFERKTRLELATPTLARLCSTN